MEGRGKERKRGVGGENSLKTVEILDYNIIHLFIY